MRGDGHVSPAIGHHEARVDNEEEEGEDKEEDLHNSSIRWDGEGLRMIFRERRDIENDDDEKEEG